MYTLYNYMNVRFNVAKLNYKPLVTSNLVTVSEDSCMSR